jgi:aryl-alcohol dehydrogenase-like predicted oxidoreductase
MAARVLTDRNLDIADAVGKIAAELGSTPTAVALAWVLSQRGVTSVIIGPRTLKQFEENEPGFSLSLDKDTIHRLNEVSRPPR